MHETADSEVRKLEKEREKILYCIKIMKREKKSYMKAYIAV